MEGQRICVRASECYLFQSESGVSVIWVNGSQTVSLSPIPPEELATQFLLSRSDQRSVVLPVVLAQIQIIIGLPRLKSYLYRTILIDYSLRKPGISIKLELMYFFNLKN